MKYQWVGRAEEQRRKAKMEEKLETSQALEKEKAHKENLRVGGELAISRPWRQSVDRITSVSGRGIRGSLWPVRVR